MKVVVELDDFWMDSDSESFEKGFKGHISNRIKNEVYANKSLINEKEYNG